MKTLKELRTEIELGMIVYPTTNPDISVKRGGESYSISATKPDGMPLMSMGYGTLDDLIADDITGIAAQPVWSTIRPQPPVFTPETPFAELGMHSVDFPEAATASEVIAATVKTGATQAEWADESTVPLDSLLGRDVAAYADHFFPGSCVTAIQSSFHEGMFIGDYSIDLTVQLEHPIVQRVGISFCHEDVPGRPPSWQKLLAMRGIRLYMNSITLRNVRYGAAAGAPYTSDDASATYTTPRMYQEEIEQWGSKHGDGMGYTHLAGKDVLIIATEGIERETLKAMERVAEEGTIPTQE